MTQILKFVLGRVENIVGKRENAGFSHYVFKNFELFGKEFEMKRSLLKQMEYENQIKKKFTY